MHYKLLSLLLILTHFGLQAQDQEVPVAKGDYQILKLDLLNLMGLGVQKLHFSYEVSPLSANKNNLPTFNFNLNVPFASSSQTTHINYGLEAGGELRFYQLRRHQKQPVAEGFFLGFGVDGGYVRFNRIVNYYNPTINASRETKVDYNRTRTGIYFLTGGSSKIGEKLYFEGSLGLGWMNANVKAQDQQTYEGYSQSSYFNDEVVYYNYQPGKGQRFYMPVNVSIGYNFGSR